MSTSYIRYEIVYFLEQTNWSAYNVFQVKKKTCITILLYCPPLYPIPTIHPHMNMTYLLPHSTLLSHARSTINEHVIIDERDITRTRWSLKRFKPILVGIVCERLIQGRTWKQDNASFSRLEHKGEKSENKKSSYSCCSSSSISKATSSFRQSVKNKIRWVKSVSRWTWRNFK